MADRAVRQPSDLSYTPFERLASDAERELRDEAAALVRFVEPEAASYSIDPRAAA